MTPCGTDRRRAPDGVTAQSRNGDRTPRSLARGASATRDGAPDSDPARFEPIPIDPHRSAALRLKGKSGGVRFALLHRFGASMQLLGLVVSIISLAATPA